MVAAVQITKEGKRIEEAIEKNMEKLHKTNFDASWARSGEEFAKMEKLNQEHNQQVLTSASVAHKDTLVAIEKILKKEIPAAVPAKGMVEHTNTVQQKVKSTCSPLAFDLRDAINSASSMTQTLNSELADGGRRMMAHAVGGAGSIQVNPLISNRPSGDFHEKVEAPVDPTRELSRLLNEHKYEEAFTAALQRSDVRIVSCLCSQVDLHGTLASNPIPLTQVVLLSLLQQLACDFWNATTQKLSWMMDVVVAIKPSDGIIAMHVRPIFEKVYSLPNN
ncbi:hypothetical protein Tco_0503275 [Tanacetum coccineum]